MHFIKKNVPAKWDKMFVWGKNIPPKQNPGFMKVGTLLIYFTIFSFLIESFYEVKCRFTEALALPGCFFSIEIPPKKQFGHTQNLFRPK